MSNEWPSLLLAEPACFDAHHPPARPPADPNERLAGQLDQREQRLLQGDHGGGAAPGPSVVLMPRLRGPSPSLALLHVTVHTLRLKRTQLENGQELTKKTEIFEEKVGATVIVVVFDFGVQVWHRQSGYLDFLSWFTLYTARVGGASMYLSILNASETLSEALDFILR